MNERTRNERPARPTVQFAPGDLVDYYSDDQPSPGETLRATVVKLQEQGLVQIRTHPDGNTPSQTLTVAAAELIHAPPLPDTN